ncbi:hypothetical protein HH214_15545 [Mucilaginibacter robiniae]|uniref:Uncharacterized protein n=1 Tax=Mucilaginibacter robiniae TaxID=2728022 RepID=A0A7L5E8I0_9SPHI|nr:hypothetical protein [Mucilaginibacter robiniae]QJD97183.1 hypothetical protein HH214_15545 [Mucilaginibacter robiniae]
MSATDLIKKEFKGKSYEIKSITSSKIEIEIPGGLDFTKTSEAIFNTVIHLKPELGLKELKIVVKQINLREIKI